MTGSSAIAAFGKRNSIAWTRICRSCKRRRKSVDARTRDSDAFSPTPSDRELVFTRVFNAPRRHVFDAWTKPAHLVSWYGCHRSSLVVCEVDLRLGGAYRLVVRMDDGG